MNMEYWKKTVYFVYWSVRRHRGKSLTRTPLRIGVDIVKKKNIVEKHGCFVLVITWPQNRRRVQSTTYNYNQPKSVDV